MAKWDGKSKGNLLGYKIFIYLMKTLGIRSAYILLAFVSFYYLIFSRQGTKASYYYFHKRKGYSWFKSIVKVYKSNYVFGQTIIDKVAIKAGLSDRFTFEFDGEELLFDLLDEEKGGILISAHVGNFEIAEHFFNGIDTKAQINLVTTNQERQAIQQFMDQVAAKSSLKFITVGDDLSHIFEMNNALERNELICFTGDRYFEGNKVMSQELLGKEANFPAGPFQLASRLKVPVIFVYVMKESSTHYHLYARQADFQKRDQKELLAEYTRSIEWVLDKYEYQWFNFFDFWNDIS